MSQAPLKPEESPVPLLSFAEAQRLGLDVAKVRTCAVRKEGEVKGCSMADRCATRMFGRPEYGGFGPKYDRPGTPGNGPENVPYYRLESSTNTEKEDYMPCYAFMVSLYDMHEQQDKTGDIIEVLGRQGDKITQKQVLPMDPGACNKNGNMGMKEDAVIITVPEFPKFAEASSGMSYALKLRENRRAMARANRRGRIAEGPGADAPESEAGEEVPVAEAGPATEGETKGARGNRRGA